MNNMPYNAGDTCCCAAGVHKVSGFGLYELLFYSQQLGRHIQAVVPMQYANNFHPPISPAHDALQSFHQHMMEACYNNLE
jgi:hypothetical protein